MSSNNDVYINRDPETRNPYSCSIRVNDSVLLTPNIFSSKALALILKSILDRIESTNRQVLSDSDVIQLMNKYKENDSFQWNYIDAMRIDGEWKIWLCIGAINVYLNVEEAKTLMRNFKKLDFSNTDFKDKKKKANYLHLVKH